MQVLTMWVLLSVVFCAQVSANVPTTESNVVNSAVINVDGLVTEEKPATDSELQQIRTEIERQKTETTLNREKAKNFKVLKKSVEQLSETTEEYLSEKKEAKAQIAEYNLKVRCMQTEDTSSECSKYNRKR
jgi:septal ring factor EnvC (AmiA/AmiB activator)